MKTAIYGTIVSASLDSVFVHPLVSCLSEKLNRRVVFNFVQIVRGGSSSVIGLDDPIPIPCAAGEVHTRFVVAVPEG